MKNIVKEILILSGCSNEICESISKKISDPVINETTPGKILKHINNDSFATLSA